MIALFGVMWFVLIRPQRKEEKRQQALRSALKRGDKVVTIGGAHAEIVAVGETTVDLKLGSGDEAAVVTFNKSAVGTVVNPGAAADAGKAK